MMPSLKETFLNSFQSIFTNFAQFVVNFIVAAIIFIIGSIIANLAGKGVEQIVHLLRIDTLLRKADIEKYFVRAGLHLNAGKFFGAVVKWFLIVLTLVQSLSILHLNALTAFLESVVMYLPNVVVAILILLAGLVIGEFLSKVVMSGVRAAQMGRASLIGNITRWVVWLFAIYSALDQLGVVTALLNYIVMGLTAGFALAFGLAFGLGGKEAAARTVNKLYADITEHRI